MNISDDLRRVYLLLKLALPVFRDILDHLIEQLIHMAIYSLTPYFDVSWVIFLGLPTRALQCTPHLPHFITLPYIHELHNILFSATDESVQKCSTNYYVILVWVCGCVKSAHKLEKVGVEFVICLIVHHRNIRHKMFDEM